MINTAVLANMKKAQGLTLNTIIIAALALLVLVILALIFTGRIQIFGRETASCKNNGGECNTGTDCPAGSIVYNAVKCPEGQVCCLKTKGNI